MDWRSQEEAQLWGHATPASKANKPTKRSAERWSHALIVCSTMSSWTYTNCWLHRHKMVTSTLSLSRTHATCWPHRHKMVTSTSSLSSTTTLMKPPPTDHATIHKLDRHSRPLSLGHNHQPGKQSRCSIPTSVANARQATPKEHRTTLSHYTTPHQLTPSTSSLPTRP